MRPVRAVLAVLPLVAVAACGQSAPAADADALSSSPWPPDALVAQVARTGGFLPVGAAFSSLPGVSVYADGRVITQGAQIEVYPQPALPSVHVGELDRAQVQRLVDDGLAVVEPDEDYGQPPVADAPTTVVVVGAGEQREVASALALDETTGELAPSDVGITPEQQQARQALSEYVDRLRTAATQVPAERYEAPAMAVLAMPYGELAPVNDAPPQQLDWPGPALADGEPSGPGSCVVVTGEQLAAVRSAAAEASQETAWRDGGQVWRLAFRPLLPHEQSCDDVLSSPAPPSP